MPQTCIFYNQRKLRLACVRDKLRNHVTHGGEILHTDRYRAYEGHGLGLLLIGGPHWAENCRPTSLYFLKTRYRLCSHVAAR